MVFDEDGERSFVHSLEIALVEEASLTLFRSENRSRDGGRVTKSGTAEMPGSSIGLCDSKIGGRQTATRFERQEEGADLPWP